MSEYQKERRRYLRMKTNLEGSYWRQSFHGASGKEEKALVMDLSTGGCRLSVSDDHNLQINDVIKLSFNLDDTKGTKIEKEAVVCRVDGHYIGLRFLAEYDKNIWFYVHGSKQAK